MKKRHFVLPVLLAFALSTVALPAFAQGQSQGKSQDKRNDKSQAKLAKEQEKADRKQKKLQNKAEKERKAIQEAADRDEIRFRGLDRDHDDRITRAEWRGNDRSFANQDWNGDGVLSGDEVRGGAQRTGRFADLDRNNDGVIARNEWNGGRQAFDRLDSNRDGILSGDEFGRRDYRDDRKGRFADLDHNNNGVIERNEWNGDLGAFDRLDANRDGKLSRNEFSRRF